MNRFCLFGRGATGGGHGSGTGPARGAGGLRRLQLQRRGAGRLVHRRHANGRQEVGQDAAGHQRLGTQTLDRVQIFRIRFAEKWLRKIKIEFAVGSRFLRLSSSFFFVFCYSCCCSHLIFSTNFKDRLYNEFFRWKKHFRVVKERRQLARPAFCSLCRRLHQPQQTVQIYQVHSFPFISNNRFSDEIGFDSGHLD